MYLFYGLFGILGVLHNKKQTKHSNTDFDVSYHGDGRSPGASKHLGQPYSRQTVSDWLVNIVDHIVAKEPDMRWWRPKTELKETECWTCILPVDRNTKRG